MCVTNSKLSEHHHQNNLFISTYVFATSYALRLYRLLLTLFAIKIQTKLYGKNDNTMKFKYKIAPAKKNRAS